MKTATLLNYKNFRSLPLITCLLMSTISLQAQDVKIQAKFIIQDGRFNKIDISELLNNDGAYLALYTIAGGKGAFFGSVMPKSKTQSYGKIYDLMEITEEATDSTYRIETYYFKWSYVNNYDSKKGMADVTLLKISKDAGIAFECTIVPENLDIMLYKGYMQGSIKNLNED